MMGSTEEERTWAVGAEGQVGITMLFEKGTPKRTQIKDGYWLGRTEVTVSQWKRFVEATNYVTEAEKKGFGAAYDTKTGKGSQVKDACWRNPHFGFELKNDHPVCCVTWDDAFAFCEWLTETEKNAGKLPPGLVYRLPGEAEWEYACRAGTATKFWWGDKMTGIERRVNGSGKNDGYAYVAPVNTYGARGRNRFGLADMLGNVWEWCLDGFDPEGPHQEPYLAATSSKVMRGGSFHDTPGWTRSAYRCRKPRNEPSVLYGFRICCGVPY